MADINLNIGSDDLDKLKKLLAEIQKAADKLKKTIEQAGSVTDDDVAKSKRLAIEHKKLENQLNKEKLAGERIAAQQERYNTKLKESKGIIGGLEKEARQFRSAMKSANSEGELKKAQAGLKKTQEALAKAKGTTASWGKALGSFQFKFNALGNIAANVLGKITQALKDAARESVQLALQAEGIGRAFNKLNKPDLLKNLQVATRGTVDNVKLMQAAVQAKNFKIPLEQLATFFEFATNRAIETGESVDYLVQSIITGIGRKSVLVMDNLGISAVELQEEVRKVGDFGLAAGNIIQRAMEDAGVVMDTASIKVSRLKTEWINFRTELASTFTEGLENQLDYFQAVDTILKDMDTSALQRIAAFMGFMSEQKTFALADAIKEANLPEAVSNISSMQVNTKKLFDTDASFNFQSSGLWGMAYAIAEIKKTSKELADENDLKEWAKTVSDLFDSLKDEANDFKNDIFDEGGDIEPWMEQLFDPDFDLGPTEDKFNAFIDKLIADWDDGMNKMGDSTDENFDEILRKISSVTSTASTITSQFSDIFTAAKAKELSAVGDNAEKRLAIETAYAKKEQQIAIASALINTAEGIVKVLADYGLPWGLIPAAAMAALGGIQVAAIKNQKFAEGGPVLGEPHSRGGVNLEAEGGEYIINKRSTGKYKDLIEAINQDDQARIMDAMSRDKKIVIKQTDPYTKKMYELMQNNVQYGEDNEFYYKHKGNMLIKTRKR